MGPYSVPVAWQVVIAGGGFGGFYAARSLERLLPTQSARVTLVNEANFMLYTPLLPGAAGATLDPRHVVVPLRSQLKRTDLVIGQVVGADPARRTLGVERIDGARLDLRYDQLVVALGSVSRTLPIPGLAEYAIGLKSLGDATALRNHVLGCLDIAESLDDEVTRAEYLGFVFVGAGYAGVEGLAELQDFAAQAIELYPRCRAQGMSWVLVEAGKRIMQEVPESLSEFAERELRGRGIEVYTGMTLREVSARSVLLSGGETIPARTVVWTAGVKPSPVLARLGLPWIRAVGSSWIGPCTWIARDRRRRAWPASEATAGCGRSATAPRFPTRTGPGSPARRRPSTRSVRGDWWPATSWRHWGAARCGRFATGRKGSSPSWGTTAQSRSPSASAGVAFRRGSSPAPTTCC